MSADNGIYIVQIPTTDGVEYRVAECQNIEDCYPQFPVRTPEDGWLSILDSDEMIDATRVIMFRKAPIFKTKEAALEFAQKIFDSVEGHWYFEYGIQDIPAFERALPGWSVEEAERVHERIWAEYQKLRDIKEVIE